MSIERKHINQRMSQIVIHGDVIYLAGQVAQGAPGKPVGEQTRDILGRIETLLGEAGTDKTKLLTATIWLANIAGFDEMNEVWEAWLAPGHPPARACVEAKLASTEYTVEIMVTAGRS